MIEKMSTLQQEGSEMFQIKEKTERKVSFLHVHPLSFRHVRPLSFLHVFSRNPVLKRVAFIYLGMVILGCRSMLVGASEEKTPAELIVNGDFSGETIQIGENRCPSGWEFSGDVVVARPVDDGGNYVKIYAAEPTGGYVYQTIPVDTLSGKEALFQCGVKFQDCRNGPQSYMKARVLVNYLTSDGWHDFYRFFEGTSDWQPVAMHCKFPDDTKNIQVMFGFHTSSGTLWVKNVRLSPVSSSITTELAPGVIETDYGTIKVLKVDGRGWSILSDNDPALSVPLKFTEEEKSRGFVVYRRASTMVAPAVTKPERKEILSADKPVKISLCAGETRSAVVIMYPLRDIPSVKMVFEPLESRVAADFSLRVDYLETMVYRANWYEQYAEMPRMIRRFKTLDLPANKGCQFWIYCNVPENTPAGVYQGKAGIFSEGKVIGSIPLEITVYPFKLEAVPVHWSFYYYYPPDGNLYDELKYMQSLGMNSIIYSPPATSIFSRLKLEEGQPKFDFGSDDEFMQTYKKAGYTAPVVYYPRLLLLRLLQLYGADKQMEQGDFYGTKIPLLKSENDCPEPVCTAYQEIIRIIGKHAREAGWPEIIWYLTDEPTLGNWTEWETALSYRLAKEACPGIKTFCTGYGTELAEKYGKYIDYISAQGLQSSAPAAKNKDMLAACRKTGADLWASCWPGLWWHNYWYARVYAGFVCARSGFEGMNIWYFSKPGRPSKSSPADPYWSLRPGADNSLANTGLGLYGMNENGEMENSTILEGLREGILDYRYLATLRKAIIDAGAKGKKVSAYEKTLDEILTLTPLLPVSDQSFFCDSPGLAGAGSWSVEKNEELRQRIAEMIITIQGE